MEIANLATTLQIAGYFNRAEKVGHPALKASILGSLVKKVYGEDYRVSYSDGFYSMEHKDGFARYTNFQAILGDIKHYIEKNFYKIQNLVKNDPMLFIR